MKSIFMDDQDQEDDRYSENGYEESEAVDEADARKIQKKLKKLRDQLRECGKEKSKYLENLQRSRADFINARRQEEEGRKELATFIKRPLLLELLGIVDNLERALAAPVKKDDRLREGIKQIHKQLQKFLENNGVEKMKVEKLAFDPVYHESVGEVEVKDEFSDHKIVEEVESGYLINDSVLRPAKVKIGKRKSN